MTAIAYLPAATERVTLREIPRLIALALHPPVPDHEPRRVQYVRKVATAPELAAKWVISISLTPDDVEALNTGPWAHLPPLLLAQETSGTQEFENPPTEAEWKLYAQALVQAPPDGWTLEEPVWHNPVAKQAYNEVITAREHKKELERLALRGEIEPKSPDTRLVQRDAMGERLQGCYLTVEEFRQYASRYGVSVRREFVRRSLVRPLLAELREFPLGEVVTVSHELTSRGDATAPVGDLIAYFEEIAVRQQDGYFTLEEAAVLLCEEHQQLSPAALIERWSHATIADRRLVRGTDKLSLLPGAMVQPSSDLVKATEVDDWHRQQGDDYSLAKSISSAVDEDDSALTPLPTELHGRKLWRLQEAIDAIAWEARVPAGTLMERAIEGIQNQTLKARDSAGFSVPAADVLPEMVNRFYAEDFNRWLDANEVPFSFRLPDSVEKLTPAIVEDSASKTFQWSVKKPQRYHGYTAPLHRLISAAHRQGKSCPTAREVLEIWRIDRPAEIAQVLADGFDYYDARGNTKSADLDAVRNAIDRMTSAR